MSITNEQRIALLEIVKFLKEKLEEAQNDSEGRAGALCEAEGCIPYIREVLPLDGACWAQAMLLVNDRITDANWRDWWKKLVKKDDDQIRSEIADCLKLADLLTAVISQSKVQ